MITYILQLYRKLDGIVKIRLFICIFATLLTIALNIGTPLVLLKIINSFSSPIDSFSYKVLFVFGSYGLVWTVARLVDQSRTMLLGRVAFRSATLINQVIFQRLLSLPLSFHHKKQTAEIIVQLQRSEIAISNLLWQLFIFVIPTTVEIILSSSILYYRYGAEYALALLVTFMLYCFFTSKFLKYSVAAQNNARNISTECYGKIGDILINYETVKLSCRENYEHENCYKALLTKEDALTKRLLVAETIMLGQKLIIGIGLICLTLFAAKNVSLGILKVGDFILITSYILQFYNPLSSMTSVLRELSSARGDLKDLDYLFKPSEVTANGENKSIIKQPIISFENVNFNYDDSRKILTDISFEFFPGKKIAIVGESGSGKSTLGKLLYRFYDPSSGRILINNIDIKMFELTHLRNSIGIVPQDIVLFNDTLEYNITYGSSLMPDKKKLDEVIQATELKRLVQDLPLGLNTIVGERGLKFSGGEKQRVGIARMLLKNAPILIFDEAGSSLDSNSEFKIQENLNTFLLDKATLIITHRLYNACDADEILVMHDGKIIEGGNHASLMSKNGKYKQLWDSQHASYQPLAVGV